MKKVVRIVESTFGFAGKEEMILVPETYMFPIQPCIMLVHTVSSSKLACN